MESRNLKLSPLHSDEYTQKMYTRRTSEDDTYFNKNEVYDGEEGAGEKL